MRRVSCLAASGAPLRACVLVPRWSSIVRVRCTTPCAFDHQRWICTLSMLGETRLLLTTRLVSKAVLPTLPQWMRAARPPRLACIPSGPRRLPMSSCRQRCIPCNDAQPREECPSGRNRVVSRAFCASWRIRSSEWHGGPAWALHQILTAARRGRSTCKRSLKDDRKATAAAADEKHAATSEPCAARWRR